MSETLIDRLDATASARTDGVLDLAQLHRRLGGKPLVELGVIFELVDDRAHQRLRFGILGLFLLDQLDFGLLMPIGIAKIDQAGALGAFDQHADRAVGQLQQLHRGGDHAQVVERIAIGIVLARVELGDQEQLLVGGHRRFKRRDGFLAPDEQRDDAMRENDDVAKRKDGKRTGCHVHLYGRGTSAAQQRRGRILQGCATTGRPGAARCNIAVRIARDFMECSPGHCAQFRQEWATSMTRKSRYLTAGALLAIATAAIAAPSIVLGDRIAKVTKRDAERLHVQ